MKNKYLIIFLVIGLVACNAEKRNLESSDIQEMNNESEQLALDAILAANPAIKIGPLITKVVEETIKCTGTIHIPPTDEISIHSKSEGFVEQIRYIAGDYVQRGALLFTIYNPSLIEKQRLLLETKAELDLAKKELARKDILVKQNATTQKSYDAALGKKDLFNATYQGLKNELQMLGIDINVLESEKKFQSKLRIYAPQSGFVHNVHVNKGQRVLPENELMSLANDDHIHLELNVLPKDVSLIAIGQKVRFRLPDGKLDYTAIVEKINPMIDEENGTLNVHCHIDRKKNDMIKVGLFANAEIEVGSRIVTGLPLDAVVKEGEDYFMYVVEGDQLHKHELRNPIIMNGFVDIDSIGKEVVVAGAYYVE